ncbi:hypothetical protein D9M71_592600 [compost metagenome]
MQTGNRRRVAQETVPHHFVAGLGYRERQPLERQTVLRCAGDPVALRLALEAGGANVLPGVFQIPLRVLHGSARRVDVDAVGRKALEHFQRTRRQQFGVLGGVLRGHCIQRLVGRERVLIALRAGRSLKGQPAFIGGDRAVGVGAGLGTEPRQALAQVTDIGGIPRLSGQHGNQAGDDGLGDTRDLFHDSSPGWAQNEVLNERATQPLSLSATGPLPPKPA